METKATELLNKHMYKNGSRTKLVEYVKTYKAVIDAINEALNLPIVSNRRELLYAVCDELEKVIDKPIPPSLKSIVVNKVLGI